MDGFDAAPAAFEGALDADLMAFAARRLQRREEREAQLEASLQAAAAPKADAAHIEFIEVVGTPVKDAVKVAVDVVDAADGASAAAESLGASHMAPVERDDYAVRRVAELSDLLAKDFSFAVTDEVRREAEEARRINIAAQESAKKAREGAAAKPGAKRPASTARASNTETKAAVKQAQ